MLLRSHRYRSLLLICLLRQLFHQLLLLSEALYAFCCVFLEVEFARLVVELPDLLVLVINQVAVKNLTHDYSAFLL